MRLIQGTQLRTRGLVHSHSTRAGAVPRGVISDSPLAGLANARHQRPSVTTSPERTRRMQHMGDDVARLNPRSICLRLIRLRRQRLHTLGRDITEALQQIRNRLILHGDTSDSLRTRDHAHLIGVITRIVRLPQRIRTPPTTHILINDRHKIHRLTRGARKLHKPRHIRRMQQLRRRLRVELLQPIDDVAGLTRHINLRVKLALILRIQASLRTGNHLLKTTLPTNIHPIRVLLGRARQLKVTAQPLGISHRLKVTKIGLRSLADSLNNLRAPGRNRGLIPRDVIKQTPSLRRRIINLVNIRTQLRTARRHAIFRMPRANPLVNTFSVNQQLLHRIASLGLFTRHRHGTQQNAINRHQRAIIRTGPLTRDVIRSALRRTNTTTDTQHNVVTRADISIRRQQQIIQVLPRVVATSAAALHLNNDRNTRHRTSNRQHINNLLDRTGLEDNPREARSTQLVDKRHGLVMLRHTGGDHNAVNRSTIRTGLRHQALAANLHLPQIRIQEHRVELGIHTRLQQLLQLRQVALEDLRSHLAATSKLRPVASIRRGSNDLWVNSRGRHTRKQHRGTPRKLSELGDHTSTSIHLLHTRRETRPRSRQLQRLTQIKQTGLPLSGINRERTNTQTSNNWGGEHIDTATRADVKNPPGPSINSTIDINNPIHRIDYDVLGDTARQIGIQATRLG